MTSIKRPIQLEDIEIVHLITNETRKITLPFSLQKGQTIQTTREWGKDNVGALVEDILKGMNEVLRENRIDFFRAYNEANEGI